MTFNESNTTFESAFLGKVPNSVEFAKTSQDFQEWKEQLTAIDVDNEVLYIRGGDMLKDEAQITYEWLFRSYRQGLLPDEIAQELENNQENEVS